MDISHEHDVCLHQPTAVTARSKTCPEIIGSIPTQGMDVYCVRLFCV
jgi:hypothetical protein